MKLRKIVSQPNVGYFYVFFLKTCSCIVHNGSAKNTSCAAAVSRTLQGSSTEERWTWVETILFIHLHPSKYCLNIFSLLPTTCVVRGKVMFFRRVCHSVHRGRCRTGPVQVLSGGGGRICPIQVPSGGGGRVCSVKVLSGQVLSRSCLRGRG